MKRIVPSKASLTLGIGRNNAQFSFVGQYSLS